MSQFARNLSDTAECVLIDKQYLIHDRDPLPHRRVFEDHSDERYQSVKLPPSSLNLSARAERFVTTIKESCLERLISVRRRLIAKGIHEFAAH